MSRPVRVALVVFACLAIGASAAFAQASITGVVKDTSGAVLPGATVEAASPALIEKVRSVVADGAGQYRIVDLRPGVYTVTFTLPGFAAVRREGIELAGTFTATVNAELRVGTLEEAITVTGETPVVDVQSAQQQQIVSHDVIAALPTGRSYQNLITLNPGVVVNNQDVGGNRGPRSDRYTVHGSAETDSRIMVDGLGVASVSRGGASGSYYVPNVSTSQEVVATTSGGLGEAETSGVVVNVIPRDGGNTTSGVLFGTGATGAMQSDNYTQALKDRGLQVPNRVQKVWDLTPAIGGRIVRDKLWYFLSARHTGFINLVAGMFENAHVGDPNAWTYEPNLNRQATQHGTWWSTALRLTWQASQRHKFSAFWDEQYRCECPWATSTASPESQTRTEGIPRVQQATWTSPHTNRLLLEAGFGTHWLGGWGGNFTGPDILQRLIPVTEQAGAIPGLLYRAINGRSSNRNNVYNWRASVSYVTGGHNAKIGYRGSFYNSILRNYYPNGGLAFRFNNGVPNRITQSVESIRHSYLQTHGVYAQDQWTVRRLTLQGAVRYDLWSTSFPEAQLGPENFMPVAFTFPATSGASFHDISPRMAAAYDLFGNGTTAVNIHLGKYMVGQESEIRPFGQPMGTISRLATSTNRSWNDLNRNFVPDCDLRNRAANGECGAMDNQSFGTDVFNVTYDPTVIAGWGVRPYSWELGASVQRELVPRVSTTIGYFRRWYGNFAVTDNLATSASDYTLFKLPVPVDPRLPTSGSVLTVATINPDKFGRVNNQVTAASHYGTMIQLWQGMDVSVDARPRNGVVLQGGVSMGRTLLDNCEVAAKLPEILGTLPMEFCRQQQPLLTQAKFLGTYTIPRVDVQVSGTWQNIPGPVIQANYNVPNAVVASLIGRNLAGNTANQTVSLVNVIAAAPGGNPLPVSISADRINQVDFRLAKLLRFGRRKTVIGLDLYNALNSSAVLEQNTTFGPAWLTPGAILAARLAKIGVQLDF
jgi:hypothetical protein